MKTGPLTPDAQVTLLLCSHLAKGSASKSKPFTLAEWNELAQALVVTKLTPSVLLEMDSQAMQDKLGLSAEQTERIRQLLGRGLQLAVELERLNSFGIWALTRSDEAYPALFKKRLGAAAPPVLFGAGDQTLLTRGYLAVVGSRDLDEAGERFAANVGAACAREGAALVSGGARGVDRVSMDGCLDAGGSAIGVLADSLEKVLREPRYRAAVANGRLVLVTAVHPRAPFSVASAMARNKYIYCLASFGLVVASSEKRGGTRAGALEALKHRWVPLFVRVDDMMPAGNRDLVSRGALPFPATVFQAELGSWLESAASNWAAPVVSKRKGLVESAPPPGDDDLFPVVWPHIEARMGKSISHEELARRLGVGAEQLKAWIERAEGLGLLRSGGSSVAAGEPLEQAQFEL